MWTLACPFINKGLGVHKLWLDNLKRVRLPRAEMKLLFVDLANNDEITKLYSTYLAEHGGEYLKTDYVKNPLKVYPNVKEALSKVYGKDRFYDKRKSVSETMRIINSRREGDMLLWEDDVLVPENAFEYMKLVFDSDDKIWSVGGTQYSRNVDWYDAKVILAWTRDENRVIYKKFDEEKESGVEFVTATATGFQLYKEKFLKDYTFDIHNERGQDIVTGININKLGGKVALCWQMKFAHIQEEDGEVVVYKSPMCKLKVNAKNFKYAPDDIKKTGIKKTGSPTFKNGIQITR